MHPYPLFRDKNIVMSEEERLIACTEYLCDEAAPEFCRDRMSHHKETKTLPCSCLHILSGNDELQEAVARYMLFFLIR